jgi:hypothetical protein
MAGLDPAIHALLPRTKTWMPATSAGMTANVRHILENAALAWISTERESADAESR